MAILLTHVSDRVAAQLRGMAHAHAASLEHPLHVTHKLMSPSDVYDRTKGIGIDKIKSIR